MDRSTRVIWLVTLTIIPGAIDEGTVPQRPRLAHELRVACMRIARRARQESGGLAPHLFAALAPLEVEPRTATWLAAREQVSNASMSRTVKDLESLGFLRRSEHPTDGRQRVLTMTPAGRAAIAESRRRRTSWMNRQLEDCTAEELEVLTAATAILTRMTERPAATTAAAGGGR
ncbi:MarR family transcriptional regulator [Enemella evansiae]|uniref:MarR family transcriptional regulator n=2 Tax=Enemella evansiae TaxID=2016499 RepID=A0A255G2C9_9ACTN|nr:MarR family transcriptional regulator [Enemella evansiae]